MEIAETPQIDTEDTCYWLKLSAKRDPFPIGTTDGIYYPVPQWNEPLGSSLHLARFSRSLVLILGRKGSGKSTLKQQFLTHISEHLQILSLAGSKHLTPYRLIRDLQKGFSLLKVDPSDGIDDAVGKMGVHFQSTEPNALLVLDDAQNLPLSTIEMLFRIQEYLQGGAGLHQVWFGDSALEASVGRMIGQVDRSIEIYPIKIPPLNRFEVGAYVRYRLSAVGSGDEVPLSADLIAEIHKMTGGIPAEINEEIHHYFRDMFMQGTQSTVESTARSYSVSKEKIMGNQEDREKIKASHKGGSEDEEFLAEFEEDLESEFAEIEANAEAALAPPSFLERNMTKLIGGAILLTAAAALGMYLSHNDQFSPDIVQADLPMAEESIVSAGSQRVIAPKGEQEGQQTKTIVMPTDLSDPQVVKEERGLVTQEKVISATPTSQKDIKRVEQASLSENITSGKTIDVAIKPVEQVAVSESINSGKAIDVAIKPVEQAALSESINSGKTIDVAIKPIEQTEVSAGQTPIQVSQEQRIKLPIMPVETNTISTPHSLIHRNSGGSLARSDVQVSHSSIDAVSSGVDPAKAVEVVAEAKALESVAAPMSTTASEGGESNESVLPPEYLDDDFVPASQDKGGGGVDLKSEEAASEAAVLETLKQIEPIPVGGDVKVPSSTQPTQVVQSTKVAKKPAIKKAVSTTAVLSSPEWLHANPDGYTLQLMGVSDPRMLKEFILRYQLEDRASILRTDRQGKSWFLLVYGAYASKEAAARGVQSLPPDLQRNTPWVRKIRDVKKTVRRGK